MGSVTSIAHRNADPARLALAEAQAKVRNAEAAIAAQRAAIDRAVEAIGQAEAKLEAATAAVADARQRDAEQAAKAIRTSSAIATPAGTRSARIAAQDAQDAVEIAKAALANLEADLVELENDVRWAKNSVAAAVNAIVAPVAERLLAKCRAAKLEYASDINALRAMMETLSEADKVAGFDDVVVSIRAKEQREAAWAGVKKNVDTYLTATLAADIEVERQAGIAAAAAYRQAIAALVQDAQAPLPE